MGWLRIFTRNYPGIVAGIGGFLRGLADEDNLAKLRFDWNQASNAGEICSAVRHYVSSAVRKGIAAGLIDRIAWVLVDAVVDQLMAGESLHYVVQHASCLRHLAGVVVVKLLVDAVFFFRGWTDKCPGAREI